MPFLFDFFEKKLYNISIMRLDYLISKYFGYTRSEAKKFLKTAEILVNGIRVKEAKYQLSSTDQVEFNGEFIFIKENLYYLINKPKNYICENDHPLSVLNLIDSNRKSELFTVGRLDKDTTGVLLISNDGELAHRLLSKKYDIEKYYLVSCEKPIDQSKLSLLTKGILDEGELLMAKSYQYLSPQQLIICLNEGKYHQVKRMVAAIDNQVIELERISFANLQVNDLKPGEYRSLSDEEIEELNKLVKRG